MAVVTVITLCSIFIASTNGDSIIEDYGVSEEDQLAIIKGHNDRRDMLVAGAVPNQPKASSMNKIKYCPILEEEAQKIADTCIFKPVKVKDPRWLEVGQNIYRSWSVNRLDEPEWNRPLKLWWNQHLNYIYPSASSPNTGHYTQMACNETDTIGCGYTLCKVDNGRYKYQKLYVCNYGPPGNVNKEPPY